MPATHTLEYTGERHLPWSVDFKTAYEHVHRYILACDYAAGKDVVDNSCGEGYGTAMLARVARSVIGVDIDATTIRHAQSAHGGSNVLFVQADAQQFALKPASVDLVVSFETIEHFRRHDAFLDAMRAALRPGGVLLISTPNRAVYSDAEEAHNPFHAKELYRDDFLALLTKRFRHVQLLGQSVVTASMVGTAEKDVFLQNKQPLQARFTEISADDHDYDTDVQSALAPRYYIAICSDAALPRRPNSVLLDNRETLFNEFVGRATTIAALTAEQRTAEGQTARREAEAAAVDQRLAATQVTLASTEEALNGTRRALEDTRRAYREADRVLKETQEALAATQAVLTETQGALAVTQTALGEANEAEAQVRAELVRTVAMVERERSVAARLSERARRRLTALLHSQLVPLDDADSASSALRALIVIPKGVNHFYEEAGRRLAEALRTLGVATRLAYPQERFTERFDLTYIVNASEVAHCLGDEARAVRILRRMRGCSRTCAIVTLDSVRTHWFARNLDYAQQAGIADIVDLGFHDQRAFLPDEMGNVRYHFAFNGLTESEQETLIGLNGADGERSIPWTMVGHQTAERSQLAQRLIREFSSQGVVYLPYLTAFTEQGPHLNGAQLTTLLSRTQYQIWCSHHPYFYLESERYRGSLLTGGVPIKVSLIPTDTEDDNPFPYLLVDAAHAVTALSEMDFAATRRRFVDDFLALPTLDESILQATLHIAAV